VTIRRGGTLTDSDHRLLALWAASCAEHVLDLFGSAKPSDPGHVTQLSRPGKAGGEIDVQLAAVGQPWARPGDLHVGHHGMRPTLLARPLSHIAAHESALPPMRSRPHALPRGRKGERRATRVPVATRPAPKGVHELVLDDQQLRNDICWSAFDC
jgi:hypothetical protein